MSAAEGGVGDAAERTAHRDVASGGPASKGATDRAATSDVGDRLRMMVLNGALPPGSVLSQVAIARQLGVSTTPVREAIRLLEAEGLLITERNRRARVPPLDVQDLDAVYSSRVMLESVAVALTTQRMTSTDHEALADNVARLAEAVENDDLPAWDVVHAEFHRRIVALTSPSQVQLIASLADRAERYRRVSVLSSRPRVWASVNAEHDMIAEAIIARQPAAAAKQLARHLARTALVLTADFAPEADATATRTALQIVGSWQGVQE
ncbi:GntR family transcriptional regulator [Streptomyces sp. NPDC029041]|uniref:GntR family transcriptional regulator n=1 Tax=Streptomyces sp. NPDC029041 TaxID=3155727 RepID=UPI0033F2E0C4